MILLKYLIRWWSNWSELTYDRFDLQSIIGFSYEANIILYKKINFPELKVNKEIEDINDIQN